MFRPNSTNSNNRNKMRSNAFCQLLHCCVRLSQKGCRLQQRLLFLDNLRISSKPGCLQRQLHLDCFSRMVRRAFCIYLYDFKLINKGPPLELLAATTGSNPALLAAQMAMMGCPLPGLANGPSFASSAPAHLLKDQNGTDTDLLMPEMPSEMKRKESMTGGGSKAKKRRESISPGVSAGEGGLQYCIESKFFSVALLPPESPLNLSRHFDRPQSLQPNNESKENLKK